MNINFRINWLNFMRYRQKADEVLDQSAIVELVGIKCGFSHLELSELIIANTPHEDFCKDSRSMKLCQQATTSDSVICHLCLTVRFELSMPYHLDISFSKIILLHILQWSLALSQ